MATKQEARKFPQFFYAIIASTGALIIGIILVWIAPFKEIFAPDNCSALLLLSDTNSESLTTAFISTVNAIFGAFVGGLLADVIGRKVMLIISATLWIAAWLLIAFVPNVYVVNMAKFISIIISGLFSTVVPMYLNEIAEDSIRGSVGSLFQIFVTIGILLVYVLSLFDSCKILNFSVTAVCLILLVGLVFIPESPVYLVRKNRRDEAEISLKKLRGANYDISIELNELCKKIGPNTEPEISTLCICTRANVAGLMVSAGLLVFQQYCGISTVAFFAPSILKDTGVSSLHLIAIIACIMQTLATVTSSVLVERVGRKTLLLVSSISMALFLVCLGIYFWMMDHEKDISQLDWLPWLSLMGLIISFALGLGPLPWIMSEEVIAAEVKTVGSILTASLNFLCFILTTYCFQAVIDNITRAYTLLLFTIICGLAAVFTILVVPETMGKSTQEIQNILAGKNEKNMS